MNAQSKVKKASETSKLPDGVAFVMPVADFLAAARFISTEETRYYLGGVRVEKHGDGALAVATDGHRLGVQFAPTSICEVEGIWTCPKHLKLDKRKGAPQQWIVGRITSDGKRGRLHLVHFTNPGKDINQAELAAEYVETGLDEMSWGGMLIDGTYPDWRKVLPQASKDDVVRGFNGDYLKTFGRALTLRGDSHSAPHLVMNGDENFIGVAMPMRTELRPRDWMKSLSKGLFA